MFIGYQGNLAVTFANNREEIEQNGILCVDTIAETAESVELVNGQIAVGTTEITTLKSAEKRLVRDAYLKQYVDPIASNALRWRDMPDEQKEAIENYRLYLLNLPQSENFPNEAVKTFDEWQE